MVRQFHKCNAYVDNSAVKDIDGKALEGVGFTSYRTPIVFVPRGTSTMYVSEDIRYSTTTTRQTTRFLCEEMGVRFEGGAVKFLDNVTKVGEPFDYWGWHVIPVDRL